MNRFKVIPIAMLVFFSGCLPANLPQVPTATSAPDGQIATPLMTATEMPPAPTKPTLPAVETPSSSSITPELLKNFTYWIEDFNTQAALKDGIFRDNKIDTQLIEPVALGDLNGDGQQDAAVILATNSGGSGTFFDLFALLDQNGTLQQAGFSSIGDRQAVKNLQIAHGRIILDYLTQSLNDPLCCPSEHRLRSYLLENDALRLVSEQILDSPATQATLLPDEILIDLPVTDGPLSIPQQVRGRVSQVPPEKKLAYFVTDHNAVLLAQGETPLQGEPGGPGAFEFEFNLGAVSNGLIQVEVVNSAGGILRGRSTIILISQ